MREPIVAFHRSHTEESAIVGRLLTAYGEIEFNICCILTAVYNNDHMMAVRVMYRLRSEAQRLDVADALMRHKMDRLGLRGAYERVLGAFRLCKNVRNQYAHCHWQVALDGELWFCNMETAAKSVGDSMPLRYDHTTLAILKSQEDFFHYTFDLTNWLWLAVDQKCGRGPTQIGREPETVRQPLLYSPDGEHPPLKLRYSGMTPSA